MKKREFRLLCLNNKPIYCHNSLISNVKKINNLRFSASFKSHFSDKPEEVEICFSNFRYEPTYEKTTKSFNRKTLEFLIEIAAKKAEKFSKENFVYPDKKARQEILMLIERAINKSTYYEGDYDIFHLSTEIFFNMLVSSHKLKNGNKRMSTALLMILLESFGYYFKFSNAEQYISNSERNQYWETEVAQFIRLRTIFHKKDEVIKEEIYNWIRKNSFILIHLY